MDQIIRIGMDTSKHSFQLHGVNSAEEPVVRRKFSRRQMLAFFARQPSTVIGLEAGGAAHHWSRGQDHSSAVRETIRQTGQERRGRLRKRCARR